MTPVPLLADVALRFSLGVIATLLLTAWRSVPPRFFRIQYQVVLGVLVLGVLDQARFGGWALPAYLASAGAVCAYLATVTWGLGLPRLGNLFGALAAMAVLGWIGQASWSTNPSLWAFNGASRAASGFLMGATINAMLLGHYYLTAPSMTTAPLKRAIRFIAAGWALRCGLALLGARAASVGTFGTGPATAPFDPTFQVMRWGIGFVGVAAALYLALRTVEIRSTQSATGILYIATIFVLLGELASLVASGRGVIV